MDQVFEYGQSASLKEADERDRDCENTEDEVAKSDPDNRGDPEEEQEAEQALEEEQQPSESCPAKETEEEEMPQEKHQRGNDIA